MINVDVYKDFDSRDLLRLIPIEDAARYYGLNNLLAEVGKDPEEVLDQIDEDLILERAKKIKQKYD